jgi:hypothetical protein
MRTRTASAGGSFSFSVEEVPMYVDLRVEIEKRHRVRYPVVIMFHEGDYDRACRS